ncbi:putative membrane protein [Pedobacter sp. UYEF25]
MNVKRIFGTVLTILGIAGLIYAGYGFMQHSNDSRGLIVAGIIGLIFFVSGIGLVKNTKDES